jgi:HEPN domain-containing protein
MTPPSFALVWLKQSRSDLKYARSGAADGFYSQACFVAQQAAEKALKAIYVKRRIPFPLSHNLAEFSLQLEINGKLREAAGTLDLYYISSRYPAGTSHLAPCELITEKQATTAIACAVKFLSRAEHEVRIPRPKKAKRSRAR